MKLGAIGLALISRKANFATRVMANLIKLEFRMFFFRNLFLLSLIISFNRFAEPFAFLPTTSTFGSSSRKSHEVFENCYRHD